MEQLSKIEAQKATFLQVVVLRYGKESLPLAMDMLSEIPAESHNFDPQPFLQAIEKEINRSKVG